MALANMRVDSGTEDAISTSGSGENRTFSFSLLRAMFSPAFWRTQFDDAAHATNGQVQETKDRSNKLKDAAVMAALKGNVAEAQDLLGKGSHGVQDVQAHQGIGFFKHMALTIVDKLTFGVFKLDPDNSANRSAEFNKSKDESRAYFDSFEQGIRAKGAEQGLSKEQIDAVIQRTKNE
jgi:hypothetical protein